jgi:hypothetical protein
MPSKFDTGSFDPNADKKPAESVPDCLVRAKTTDELVLSIKQKREKLIKNFNPNPIERVTHFYFSPPLDEFSIKEIDRFGEAEMGIRTLEMFKEEPFWEREKIDKILAIRSDLAPYLPLGKAIDQEKIPEAQEALDRAQIEGIKIIYHFFEELSKELSDNNEINPDLLPVGCAEVNVDVGAWGKEGLTREGVYIDLGEKSIQHIIDEMMKRDLGFKISTSIMPPDDKYPTDKWTFQINATDLGDGRGLISYWVYPPNKVRAELEQNKYQKT